ncbi:MAG TPA: hypothetical protein P5511_09150, partial [Candidatus Goldiibacteriota bacterium]|nr:hypothetical protein [Candidatus Goldiibacteriota bacterium]
MNLMLMTDELAMTGILALIILTDLFGAQKKVIASFFTAAVLGLFVYALLHRQDAAMLMGGYVYDGLSWFSKLAILLAAFLTGLLSMDTIKVNEKRAGAYYT